MAGEQQLPSSGIDQPDGRWRFAKERGGWRWNLLDAEGAEVASYGGFKTKKAAVAHAVAAREQAHIGLPPVEEGKGAS